MEKWLVEGDFEGTVRRGENELAKDLGARWDSERRAWCAPSLRGLVTLLEADAWTPPSAIADNLSNSEIIAHARHLDAFRLDTVRAVADAEGQRPIGATRRMLQQQSACTDTCPMEGKCLIITWICTMEMGQRLTL